MSKFLWIRTLFVLMIASLGLAQDKAAADKPLPADQAASTMVLPPGFRATLFAAEPDLVQPIGFTFDDRGRIWVVEALSYPTWKTDAQGSDRVTIFEDTDGDGRHDKRTVFFDKGINLSGIEVGFGGVWLTAVPRLIFIPDENGDDKPDGPPETVLDGWDLAAKHNVVGNLAWGPDGWLYGCNGILSNSRVGRPGTPDQDRVALNCGVWRFHPVRHKFEAYAHGTTNPWGLDWDERGQLFITNCVIKHIFHVTRGAHFVRMFGQDINPHSYGLIESCADHQHWAGGHWTSSRGGEGAHGDAGGGHAHSGCMIYLGDNWPDEYRGNAFTLNLHGQRLNRDRLVREGSSYIASHAADFAFSKDPWFRGVHVKYGPDGGVYISDWSDTGECHDYTEQDCDKTGGRIFKIVYDRGKSNDTPSGALGNALRGVPGPAIDLAKLSSADLLDLHAHRNEWHVRHARRVLQERAAGGKLEAAIADRLRASVAAPGEPNEPLPQRFSRANLALRSMQTLVACGLLKETELAELVDHSNADIAGLAILIAAELRKPPKDVLDRLAIVARQGGSRGPALRLYIASALQQFPRADAWPLVAGLLEHGGDADDPYLPLMDWYALEPLAQSDPRQAIALLPQIKIPLVRQYLTRRIVSVHEGDGTPKPSNAWILDELFRTFATADDALRLDVLRGLEDVYRGRRSVPPPTRWKDYQAALLTSANADVQDRTLELAVLFGDAEQMRRLEDLVMRRSRADLPQRRRALALLVAKRDPAFGKSVLMLLREPELRPEAIRALAAYDLPETAPRLLAEYPTLKAEERQDAIQTLTARPAFALALLDGIERGTIPRTDVSALVIRQVQSLDNQEVNASLAKVWGNIRPASADKKDRIAEFKRSLAPENLQAADLARGRGLYVKTCAACHKLFDAGGRVGPELTGSQRTNLDYVLDNVVDPSAIVPREYRASLLRLADGRVVQGVIVEETPQTLVVQTPNETLRVPAGDVAARKESPLSMMPEGLFDRLAADEVRDLVAYLASPQQVPLPAGESPNP